LSDHDGFAQAYEVLGLSAEDLKSLRLIEEVWKDIEEGMYSVRSKEAFFKELEEC
jgi:hypothetical protein